MKRDEAFEERPSLGRRAKESERATLTGKDTEHENNTAHEPQITSVHHRYLRRLFYVLGQKYPNDCNVNVSDFS